jgi:hypothetical protein
VSDEHVSDEHGRGSAAGDESARSDEPAWKRKQRLAEIFGDVLPSVTSDERDPAEDAGSGKAKESATDQWLKSQVPPHHGG